jgi:hypothetical protein
MINTFKKNDNKSSIDNILQNKDDYKLLSKVAYKKHQNNIEDAIKNTNYKYDPELSSQTEKVFHNPISKETVISNSGTNFRDKNIFNDLKSDSAIFFGLEKQNKRFKQSQEHLNKVKSKYGDDKIIVTGHSLGGSISEQLARSNPNINSVAFNRFSGPLQGFRKRPKNFIDISNRNDPLSYFSRSKGKNNIINNKGWHSI